MDEMRIVTLKMPSNELDALSKYLIDHDLDNRSVVIREAIAKMISEEGQGADASGDGLTIRLSPVVYATLENLEAEGVIISAEEYIRTLVENDLIPEDIMRESKVEAFKRARVSVKNA